MEKEQQKTITVESIDKLLKFLPIFEQEGYEFSNWNFPEPSEDGVNYFPHCDYSKEVDRFVKVLYEEGFIISFDWTKWQDEAQKYCLEPEKWKTADLATIQKLLTTHVRKDRFCEGHLAAMLKDGHIVAILKRLKEIREEMTGSKNQ